MRPLVILLLLGATSLPAQQPDSNAPSQPARPLNLQPALKPPVADTGIFSPIPLPPPNEIRAADGAPGPKYWQQRADYSIKATLDTAAKRLDRHRADPLHQQLAGHPAVRLDAGGPEPVPAGQCRVSAVRLGEPVRRRGVPGRIRDH